AVVVEGERDGGGAVLGGAGLLEQPVIVERAGAVAAKRVALGVVHGAEVVEHRPIDLAEVAVQDERLAYRVRQSVPVEQGGAALQVAPTGRRQAAAAFESASAAFR